MLDSFWLFISSDSYWSGAFAGVLLGMVAGIGGVLVANGFGEDCDGDF